MPNSHYFFLVVFRFVLRFVVTFAPGCFSLTIRVTSAFETPFILKGTFLSPTSIVPSVSCSILAFIIKWGRGFYAPTPSRLREVAPCYAFKQPDYNGQNDHYREDSAEQGDFDGGPGGGVCAQIIKYDSHGVIGYCTYYWPNQDSYKFSCHLTIYHLMANGHVSFFQLSLSSIYKDLRGRSFYTSAPSLTTGYALLCPQTARL